MKNFYLLFVLMLSFIFISEAQVSEQEFQALKALYNATDGAHWKNRTGWENINTTATRNDVTTSWKGIDVLEGGHITEISLNNNNLVGTIPAAIGNLIWLKSIDLGSNKLSGNIPVEFGNLVNLTGISLSANKLTGPLPASMANLFKMETVYISSNSFNAPFPNEIISNWPKLYILQASSCGFTGGLSNNFHLLPELYMLGLDNNQLTGTIPSTINGLKNLYTLELSFNAFTGPLPTLDSCLNIVTISLDLNQLSGTIPPSYNKLTLLQSFGVSSNNLTGLFPNMFSALRNFWVANNFFTFEGIEPVYSNIRNVFSQSYFTERTFPLHQNSVSVNAGEVLNLNAATLSVYGLGGNNNRYKWYRNNEVVYSGNSPIYTVSQAGATDAGVYRFEVTNTVVTGITLKSENITLNITGINQPPTDIVLSPSAIDENFTGVVGLLTVFDPDAGDTHTFTLATGNGTNDKDNSKFSINGNQLSINSNINYELTPSLNILITVSDGEGGIYSKPFVITVNNVNEAPAYNGQLTSNAIDENAANGSTALTLMAEDPEGSPVIFSIILGNSDGAFGINGNKLIVADRTKFNYDTKNLYVLTVNASDGVLSSNAMLYISLNKINQQPQVQNAVFTINENSPAGTLVGTIVATDTDPLTIHILTGNEQSTFSVSGKNILVNNPLPLDFDTKPVFNLMINVSDGISNVQASVTVNLTNLADETGNDILTFSVPGMVGQPVVNPSAHTMAVVITQVNITTLLASFTLSKGATSNPLSGTIINFVNPKVITVTSETGVSQIWTITITYMTGFAENPLAGIRVYPNPATEFLNISGLERGDEIKLFNLSGQMLLNTQVTENICRLDLDGIKPGHYTISIESDKNRSVFKIIKK